MLVPLQRLSAVVTTFALGEAYVSALDGMMASVRALHPHWTLVVGRCLPSPGNGAAAFDVDAAGDPQRWEIPVRLQLDGSGEDWRRITRLKGWWIAEVWKRFAQRLLWLDVEVRLRRPLAFQLEPGGETIAGPWWQDDEGLGRDTLTSGVLLLQGKRGGPVSRVVTAWRDRCLREIEALPPRMLPWRDGDQEILNDLLHREFRGEPGLHVLKLPHDAYCGGHAGIALDDSIIAEHGARYEAPR